MWAVRALAVVLALALPATALPVLPVATAAEKLRPTDPGKERSVPVRTVATQAPGPTAVSQHALTASTLRRPTPGVADVELSSAGLSPGRQQAGSLPIRVGGAGKVRVELLDRSVAERAKIRGELVRLERPAGEKVSGRISLEVDYSGFRDAYGADWDDRLQLTALPSCALTTPDQPECRGKQVASSNNAATGKISAEASPGLYALTAAAGGTTGNFAATSLSPSATWTSGGSSGDFSWSYPFGMPAVASDLVPQVGLSYSSQSVDGRVATTNNQPSAIGEGFDFQPGHIERRYKQCADDLGGNNGQTKTGDLCWATDNAVLSLSGHGGELVPMDASGTSWRLRNDDGTRIQRLTGAANGDNDGETWLVTSPEGTRYFFGSRPAAQSISTVPVFGNNPGEPCVKPVFADSSCTQAYRWSLDYVVDPRGNAMAYQYAAETNYYARNQNTAAGTPYVRAVQLSRIDYGLRDGEAGTAPARVVFETADRCIPGTTCGPAQPQNSPDTPWDQNCGAGACPVTSPTFWTQKRIAKVVTQTWNGTTYEPVDSWTLRQSYPSNGDATRAGLWLDGITHTGHVGGTQSMPEVVFDGVQLANRVNETNGPAMNWWRIRSIRSEFGGTLSITYADKDCSPSRLPATPESNTLRCLPSLRDENGQQKLEYFHKYVVTRVVQNANLTGDVSTPIETEYEYLGTPAWHFDDEDGLVPAEKKTWSQWRGYEKVRVKGGSSSATEAPQTYSQTQYFRGMDGDRLPGGARRTVTVTDSENVAVPDQDRLSGAVRETITFDGVKAVPVAVSGTINDPWVSAPTATAVRPWGTTYARYLGTAKSRSRTLLSSGSWRRTQTETSYGEYGTAVQVNELGDLSTGTDDRCTRFNHLRNLDKWLLTLPNRSETVSVACSVTPNRPADVLSDTRLYYDGATGLDTVPTRGQVTKTEELSGWSGSTPSYVTTSTTKYDQVGRPVEAVDASGQKSTTAYLTGPGGRLTGASVTNAAGHVTTTELDLRGEVLAQIDANGKRSELETDPLGRSRKVWSPGRRKGVDTPNAEFGYDLRIGKPNVVSTKRLQADGSYQETLELFDGLTRLRQTQLTSPGGGRTIADVIYNSQGNVVKRSNGYWNSSPAGTELAITDDAVLPAQVRTTYNGEGQATVEGFYRQGVKQWETITADGGDRTTIDPPTGATATMTVNDARGNVTQLHQFLGGAPTGSADITRYSYDKADRLTQVTDPAGNVWRYEYDLRGRQTRVEEPDRGATTLTYDDQNRLTSTVDAENRSLFFSYDVLGRVTAVHQDSPTGPVRTSSVYDTIAKGQLTSATRHSGSATYVSEITGYNDNYQPTGSKVTIPAAEGALAGTYQVASTYTANGLPSSVTVPAAGGLPAEVLKTGYDAFGQPLTLTAEGANGVTDYTYVRDTKYTAFGETSQLSLGVQGKSVWLTRQYEEGTRRLSRQITDREASGKTQADLTFGYDPAGNLTRIADQPSSFTGVPSDYQCFRNDYLRRTTAAWTPADGNCTPDPTTAKLGGPAKYWSAYSYDKSGNRTAETTYQAAGKTTKTYDYPVPGEAQPHAVKSVNVTNPDGTTRTDAFSYDKSGRTKARPGQQLTWDVEGELASVTQGSTATSFLYDANGDRLIRRDPTGTTLYVAGMELRLAGGTVSGTRYYVHGESAVAVRTGGAVHWLSTDQHGTASLAIEAESLTVNRRRFQPFGEERGPVANWPDEHGFLNAPKDPSIGLTQVGQREYDPALGRFLSVDPVTDHGDPQQLNGYAYSNNNPATYSDPTGLRATCDNDGSVTDRGCGVPVLTAAQHAEKNHAGDVGRAQSDLEAKKAELAKAKAAGKKDALIETLKTVGLDLLLDLIGFNDFRDCFTKGDVGACIGVVSNFIPMAKIGKLIWKLGSALRTAFKVFRAVEEAIEWTAKTIARLTDQIASGERFLAMASAGGKPPRISIGKASKDDPFNKYGGGKPGGTEASDVGKRKTQEKEAVDERKDRTELPGKAADKVVKAITTVGKADDVPVAASEAGAGPWLAAATGVAIVYTAKKISGAFKRGVSR